MNKLFLKCGVAFSVAFLFAGCGHSDVTEIKPKTVTYKGALAGAVSIAGHVESAVNEVAAEVACVAGGAGSQNFACNGYTLNSLNRYSVRISNVPVRRLANGSGFCRLTLVQDAGSAPMRSGPWVSTVFSSDTVLDLSDLGMTHALGEHWGNQNLRLNCIALGNEQITYELTADLSVLVKPVSPRIDAAISGRELSLYSEKNYTVCADQNMSIAFERRGELAADDTLQDALLLNHRVTDLVWTSLTAGQCINMVLQPGERLVYWWGPVQALCFSRPYGSSDCHGVDLLALTQTLGQSEISYDQAQFIERSSSAN